MYKFSNRSLQNLATCKLELQLIFHRIVKVQDCSIICGYRDQEHQQKAFEAGYSELDFPFSKHNLTPSAAVDVWPYPVPRNKDGSINNESPVWYEFIWFVKGLALGMKINLRSGSDFRGKVAKDLAHWELDTI